MAGLGFTVGSVVVDRKTLKNIGLAIGGGLTTLIAALLALTEDAEMPPPSERAGMLCELSGVESDAIEGMLRSVLAQRNSSCEFNMTIGSLLRAG